MESFVVGLFGGVEIALVEIKQAKLVSDPGPVFGPFRARVHSLLHGLDSPVIVTVKLADIGDPRIRTQVGPRIYHFLNRVGGVVHQAKLGLGVGNHPQGVAARRGVESLFAEIEPFLKLVPGEVERTEPAQGCRVLRFYFEGRIKDCFGFVIKSRVAHFAGFLQVKQAQVGLSGGIIRVGPQFILVSGNLLVGLAGAERSAGGSPVRGAEQVAQGLAGGGRVGADRVYNQDSQQGQNNYSNKNSFSFVAGYNLHYLVLLIPASWLLFSRAHSFPEGEFSNLTNHGPNSKKYYRERPSPTDEKSAGEVTLLVASLAGSALLPG